MRTAEQIKESILKHEAVISYLESQRLPYVQTLDLLHEYDERYDYNVVELFKRLTSVELNPEEMLVRDNIVQLIEGLNVSINQKLADSKKHNKDINQKINKLEDEFEQSFFDVPEIKLSSRMDLSFKNIEKVDRQHFIDAYLSFGITHYKASHEKHQIYYNPDIFHFNTFKEDIFKALPLNIQKKYPTFVAKIQNKKLKTCAESNSDLFEVIAARK